MELPTTVYCMFAFKLWLIKHNIIEPYITLFKNHLLWFINAWPVWIISTVYLFCFGRLSVSTENVLARNSIKILAPITDPEKVLCIGMNYVDHCEEQNQPVPKEPLVFNKFASCIIGPKDDIRYPDETEELDWEVEMVIVIGKAGKNIKVCLENHIQILFWSRY